MIPLTGSAMMNGCGYLVTSWRIQVVSDAESLNWWLMPRMNTSRVMGSPPPGGRRGMVIRSPISRPSTWGNRLAGRGVGAMGVAANPRSGVFDLGPTYLGLPGARGSRGALRFFLSYPLVP